MRCPYCKVDDDRVVNSRTSADGTCVKRRRECIRCGRRYTTYERVEQTPLRVIKKDGNRENFARGKVLEGLTKACHKRPVSTDSLERVVDEIERELHGRFEHEVSSGEIGELLMQHLRQLGVQVVLDNFGSGVTSLAQLRRMPIDGLKMDRALVRELPGNREHAAIATGIIHLARELGLWLVAEGVESGAQLAFLTQHGCPLLQGHYLAMPRPAEAWDDFGQRLPGPSGEPLRS